MLGIWHIWQTGSSTTNASTIIVKHWYTSGMHRLTPQLFRTGLLVDMQYLLSMFTYTWIPNTQTTLATSWPKKYDFIPLSSPWFKNKNAILTTCQKTHTYIYYIYILYIYILYYIYIYPILYIYIPLFLPWLAQAPTNPWKIQIPEKSTLGANSGVVGGWGSLMVPTLVLYPMHVDVVCMYANNAQIQKYVHIYICQWIG